MTVSDADVRGELARMGAGMESYGLVFQRLNGDRSILTGARSTPPEISDQEWRDHEDTAWFQLNYLRNVAKVIS